MILSVVPLQKGQDSPWVVRTKEEMGCQFRDGVKQFAQREQHHTYRVFVTSQKHVSPSNWTEISFSERKVTKRKMGQNGAGPWKPNAHWQRHHISDISDVHAGVRALWGPRGYLP